MRASATDGGAQTAISCTPAARAVTAHMITVDG
jgi:hypothetical protein